ncbi:MAG: hypothetical protein OXU23_00865 [Candidatus Poribacteria bacterium]|nr:hypothetical protein [Candidatus Poribacteria bacterium]
MYNIPMDRVVEIITGLGVPGIVLLVAMSVSGWSGAAAITTALAGLGGPLGMLGGITLLGGLVLIASAIPRFGFWEIFKRVLENLKGQGKTNEDILREIDGYPIANELKQKLREYIENMEGEETDEWQEARLSNLSEQAQEILSVVESLVGKDFEQLGSRLSEKIDDIKKDINEKIDDVQKDLNDKTDFEQLESRLSEKIDDVKKDINDRMDRSETRLKWFISIAVAVGGIATSGIVILIVSLLN